MSSLPLTRGDRFKVGEKFRILEEVKSFVDSTIKNVILIIRSPEIMQSLLLNVNVDEKENTPGLEEDVKQHQIMFVTQTRNLQNNS